MSILYFATYAWTCRLITEDGRDRTTLTLHQGKANNYYGISTRKIPQASQKNEEGLQIKASLATLAWNLKKMMEKIKEVFSLIHFDYSSIKTIINCSKKQTFQGLTK